MANICRGRSFGGFACQKARVSREYSSISIRKASINGNIDALDRVKNMGVGDDGHWELRVLRNC